MPALTGRCDDQADLRSERWELRRYGSDGTYTTLLARLARIEVLVLDDFLFAPMNDSELREVLEILEDRHL